MLCPGIEGYVVEDVLGHGGSATVYRARDEARRVVALKVLDDRHRGPAETARLQREFEFAQRLSHPHVVSVYRHGEDWLTMQLVDGGTAMGLKELDDRLTAMEQIADALDYVHRCGIVHCDVKPSNVLVHKYFSHGGAVLTDFGVAYAVAAIGVIHVFWPGVRCRLISAVLWQAARLGRCRSAAAGNRDPRRDTSDSRSPRLRKHACPTYRPCCAPRRED